MARHEENVNASLSQMGPLFLWRDPLSRPSGFLDATTKVSSAYTGGISAWPRRFREEMDPMGRHGRLLSGRLLKTISGTVSGHAFISKALALMESRP